MSINSFIKKSPVVVTENTSLKEAAKKMVQENVGTVVVVDSEENLTPCGIVTDRDIAIRFSESSSDDELLVRDIVQPELVSIRYDQSIRDLSLLLSEKKVRRAVIVDDNDHVAGVASMDDLLLLIAEEFNDLRKVLESQLPQ